MKEKLEELKKQKKHLFDEYEAVKREINRLENQLREENADLYKGRWYYKKDSSWNEFDDEYSELKFIYITGVQIYSHYKPFFTGISIDTDTNYRMLEFSFRRIEDLTLEELQRYTELSRDQTYGLKSSLNKMLKELISIEPCFKEELKELFK